MSILTFAAIATGARMPRSVWTLLALNTSKATRTDEAFSTPLEWVYVVISLFAGFIPNLSTLGANPMYAMLIIAFSAARTAVTARIRENYNNELTLSSLEHSLKYKKIAITVVDRLVASYFITIRPTINMTLNSLTFSTFAGSYGYFITRAVTAMNVVPLIGPFILGFLSVLIKMFTTTLQVLFLSWFSSVLARVWMQK